MLFNVLDAFAHMAESREINGLTKVRLFFFRHHREKHMMWRLVLYCYSVLYLLAFACLCYPAAASWVTDGYFVTTQTASPGTQPAASRQRSTAERHRKDTYSRPVRMAGVTTRTSEGRLIRDIRRDLIKHVGDAPSATQRALIERAVMLTVQLSRMDAKALRDGAMSDHASREYLAWSNTLTRTMKALGMKGPAPKAKTLAEIRGQKAA
jgi:hypothetical protein